MGNTTVRFEFFKKDELKYLSHLDVLALMERALMRTGMPLFYSGGFHPKPKMSFSNPIPLGVQSLAEYCDIELLNEVSAEDFTDLLNRKLPDNLKVTKAVSFEKTPEHKIPSLMSAIDLVLYEYEMLLGKPSSEESADKELSEKIALEKENLGKKNLISRSLSFDSFKSSFLKDFEKLFGPAGENEECDADLLKVRNSIHGYEAVSRPLLQQTPETAAQTTAAFGNDAAEAQPVTEPQENIFFLKIHGYAKILKGSNNTIFKFNAFNEYFEKFLESKEIEIRLVQKTGTYIFKNNVLMDPVEVISFKVF